MRSKKTKSIDENKTEEPPKHRDLEIVDVNDDGAAVALSGGDMDLGAAPDAGIMGEPETRPSDENPKPQFLAVREYQDLVKGMTPEEAKALGQNLINAALGIRKRQIAAGLIANAEELLRLKTIHEQRIADSQDALKDIAEKMTKLANGLFEVDRNAQIIFK